ncbi:MAG: ATP-binding protein [Rhodospirillales bacterium]
MALNPKKIPDEDANREQHFLLHDGGTHDTMFRAIANFTYDWETWMGVDDTPNWINPAVERITGYSCAECYAMEDYPLPIVHPDDRSTISWCLEQARADHPGNDVEFKILHKDGSERWGAVSWQTIINDRGKPVGYRTSVRDITLRKHTEQALRRAQQSAEKASADKSRFLASASHDLRQPIQAANMFVAALTRERDAAKRDHIVNSLRESLDATSELLDALLDVSRLDSGVADPHIETVHLIDILEQIETEFRPQAEEKGLRLTVVPSSRSIASDPVMLLRIVRNLVSNAMRYTESGRVLIGVRLYGDNVGIDVCDTGIGIAEGDLERVFEDFQQIANPERDRRKGLGLGLAIVRRKAAILGLSIAVQSVVGRGSVFSVRGPAAHDLTPEARPRTVSYDDIDLNGHSILYVDDDETQLEATKTLLGQWGLEVVCATSIDQAVAAVSEERFIPDAIIADFRLREGQTGATAIREVIRAAGTPIPALILTGDTEPDRIVEATASGHALLHKPVSPSILKQTLHDLVV